MRVLPSPTMHRRRAGGAAVGGEIGSPCSGRGWGVSWGSALQSGVLPLGGVHLVVSPHPRRQASSLSLHAFSMQGCPLQGPPKDRKTVTGTPATWQSCARSLAGGWVGQLVGKHVPLDSRCGSEAVFPLETESLPGPVPPGFSPSASMLSHLALP